MQTTAPARPPRGVRRWMFRLPIHLYGLGLGTLVARRFLVLHHKGRVSGTWRQVALEIDGRDAQTGAYVVASGFGSRSDWYRNLRAHPTARIQVGRRTVPVRAEFATAADGAELMATYAGRNPRAAAGLARLMGYRVDGSAEDFREFGRVIPFVRLVPVVDPDPPEH